MINIDFFARTNTERKTKTLPDLVHDIPVGSTRRGISEGYVRCRYETDATSRRVKFDRKTSKSVVPESKNEIQACLPKTS